MQILENSCKSLLLLFKSRKHNFNYVRVYHLKRKFLLRLNNKMLVKPEGSKPPLRGPPLELPLNML